MIGSFVTRFGRVAMLQLAPETAHHITIKALSIGLVPACRHRVDPRLSQNLFGLDFPNPVGLAAGFDKNGEVPDALLAQGFGFVEVGTVTPRPQPGNPSPRIFRLAEDHAMINRMGFKNEGHAEMHRRLERRRARGGLVGINIGANKTSTDRVADYVAGVEAFADLASYFTVNISSPNTPGLRDLQTRDALSGLLEKTLAARDEATERVGRRVPVLVKIAPDVDEAGLEGICAEIVERKVDGLIVSNTTLAREGVSDPAVAREAGGLSGRPLLLKSTRMLAKTRRLVGPDLPLIGVGGIDSGDTAWAKIAAGADLIQLYTGFIYEGPELIGRILDHLAEKLTQQGFNSLREAVGCELDVWAAVEEGA
ncbi:quinone-dependent dihydroorotate dehydrogenase [Breoghania sp.]|uniref:quinone-dependent dihydroorotate dehydrogenase n=1 Tax=Breoghania sp. TaxID=2065378 RepID=UPI00261AB403|nr:quinone-dependent dihydroorotate dehydrogenase [Breoghania sp.]MDJ0932931.1 quinone-dependent dihydroorotate dehydrogenase [Breoghania sp.]